MRGQDARRNRRECSRVAAVDRIEHGEHIERRDDVLDFLIDGDEDGARLLDVLLIDERFLLRRRSRNEPRREERDRNGSDENEERQESPESKAPHDQT
jgi:hypothetical protein